MWSKMRNTFYAIGGLCFIFFSCQQEDKAVRTDSAQSIYLRAEVENMIMTRSPFDLSEPNQKNPLKVAVCASTTPYEFKNIEGANGTGADNVVALHTMANFTNGKEQLLYDAVYPKDENTKVYFVGLHPADGWTFPGEGGLLDAPSDGKTATIVFNGCEDVMFAPQIDGQYGQNVGAGSWPTFSFYHLLTWLRVTVKAESELVSEAWGRLKSLKIKSKNTVTVDLGKTFDLTKDSGGGCVSFSDASVSEFDFYSTGTDDVFLNRENEGTWYSLPYDEKKEVAYVLCAPVQASANDLTLVPEIVRTAEYILLVETENRSVEVPIDLMKDASADPPTYFEENTMRNQFVLNLNFKMGNNVVVTASMTDWQSGGISNGVLDPNAPFDPY